MLQELHYIPYKDLGLTQDSKILGQSKHGLVLQANYSSMLVAVKPMLAPAKPSIKTLFSPRSPALTRESLLVPHYSNLSESLIGASGDPSASPTSRTSLIEHAPAESVPISKCYPSHFKTTIKAAYDRCSILMASVRSFADGSFYRQLKLRQQVSRLPSATVSLPFHTLTLLLFAPCKIWQCIRDFSRTDLVFTILKVPWFC